MQEDFYNLLNFKIFSTVNILSAKDQDVYGITGYTLTDTRRKHYRESSLSLPPVCRNGGIHDNRAFGMGDFKVYSLTLGNDLKDRCQNDEIFNDMVKTGKVVKVGKVDKICSHTYNLKFDFPEITDQASLQNFLVEHLKMNNEKYFQAVMRQREKAAAAGLLKQEALQKRRGY